MCLWHYRNLRRLGPLTLFVTAWPLLSVASIVIESIDVLTFGLVFDSCHRRFCCVHDFNRKVRSRCVASASVVVTVIG